MRRILLTFALMAASVSGACAFEQTDTIVNVCDAKQVSVVTSDSLLEVNINGQKDNPSYRFNFRHPLSERATTVISESSEWDFSFFSMPGSKNGNLISQDTWMSTPLILIWDSLRPSMPTVV